MPRLRRICALLLLALSLIPLPGRAQESIPHRVEVFVAQEAGSTAARLYLMDPLSGLSRVVSIEDGQHFALVGDTVIYEKARTGAIMRARADGTIEPHPFIRRGPDTARITWVVSSDRRAIAWVEVSLSGVSTAYVAWADGSELEALPIPSPEPPYELRPLALTDNRAALLVDLAAPGKPTNLPFITYTHLSEYHIHERAAYPLPGEPLCPCAAAVTPDGRLLARLEAPNGQGPFALHLWDLPNQLDLRVPAPALPYRMAGDLLLSAGGALAVYAVAAGVGPETGQFQEQYALIVVDLAAQTQRLLGGPSPVRYRPLAFLDGDGTVLAVGVNQPGTFKIDVATGAALRISADEYLGAIISGEAGLLVE